MVGLVLGLAMLPVLGVASAPAATAASGLPALPLSTSGSRVVDANGNEVVLQGVNWFGFETANHAPHGLWTRDYKDMLSQIKSLGFNVIRLPFSLQALRSTTTSGIDYGSGRNAALAGKTPQQVMDEIVAEAGRQGLMIILDNHSQADDGFMYDLWYGQSGFTEDDWVATWSSLAARYASTANVIGADLKNEPHGAATWGTGAATDWRRAAERAGDAVLGNAANWLILVEGIEGQVAGGQQLDRHWWGGNLEGVRTNPVRLDRANRLVYSPHEYGPSVYSQPWFADPNMATVLADRWSKGFGYIHDSGAAPILIGEFGARNAGLDTVEGRWIRQFADYLGRKGMSWTFWSWNPNSGDTGGVLRDDWRTVHADKMALLSALMRREAIPYGSTPFPTPAPTASQTPAPAPTLTTSPAPVPSPTSGGGVSARLELDSSWGTGWCAKLEVDNGRPDPININSISFDLPSSVAITSLWNGTASRAGNRVTVSTPSWARAAANGSYLDTGLCAGSTTLASGLSAVWTDPAGSGTTSPAPTPTASASVSSPAPITSPTLSPTPSPTPSPPSALSVTFVSDSTWETGYCRSTVVRNNGTSAVRNWTLRFNLPSSVTITESWSGTVSRAGTAVTVTPPSWGAQIGAGQSVSTFGFCASGSAQPSGAVATATA